MSEPRWTASGGYVFLHGVPIMQALIGHGETRDALTMHERATQIAAGMNDADTLAATEAVIAVRDIPDKQRHEMQALHKIEKPKEAPTCDAVADAWLGKYVAIEVDDPSEPDGKASAAGYLTKIVHDNDGVWLELDWGFAMPLNETTTIVDEKPND